MFIYIVQDYLKLNVWYTVQDSTESYNCLWNQLTVFSKSKVPAKSKWHWSWPIACRSMGIILIFICISVPCVMSVGDSNGIQKLSEKDVPTDICIPPILRKMSDDNWRLLVQMYVPSFTLGPTWQEAKSRKYQEVLKVKIRETTRQVRENWSQQLEHQQIPKRGRWNQVSGKVSFPCWHATPVASAPWKPLYFGEGQARYQGHEIGGESD